MDWTVAVTRHQNLAARGDTHYPIGESIRIVARADDEAGAHDGGDPRELLLGLDLALRFQRAGQILNIRHQTRAGFG